MPTLAAGAFNADTFKELIAEQLGARLNVTFRAMFGGWGLYRGAVFFGIIFRGQLYFKTDAQSRRNYEQHGMLPFQPNEQQTLKNYYEVPASIVEDAPQLVRWAERALACQPR